MKEGHFVICVLSLVAISTPHILGKTAYIASSVCYLGLTAFLLISNLATDCMAEDFMLSVETMDSMMGTDAILVSEGEGEINVTISLPGPTIASTAVSIEVQSSQATGLATRKRYIVMSSNLKNS